MEPPNLFGMRSATAANFCVAAATSAVSTVVFDTDSRPYVWSVLAIELRLSVAVSH